MSQYLAPGGKKILPSKPADNTDATPSYAKGGPTQVASYAAGGPVLGRTRDFMKMPDEFRDPDHAKPGADADQKYGKSGEGAGTGEVKPDKARASKVLK